MESFITTYTPIEILSLNANQLSFHTNFLKGFYIKLLKIDVAQNLVKKLGIYACR